MNNTLLTMQKWRVYALICLSVGGSIKAQKKQRESQVEMIYRCHQEVNAQRQLSLKQQEISSVYGNGFDELESRLWL